MKDRKNERKKERKKETNKQTNKQTNKKEKLHESPFISRSVELVGDLARGLCGHCLPSVGVKSLDFHTSAIRLNLHAKHCVTMTATMLCGVI